jgi:hypothetical protein
MMTCRTATALHIALEEGALSGARLLRYRVHMTLCGPCQRYRAQLERTRSLLAKLPPEPAAPPSLTDLLADVLAKPEDKM